MKIDCLKYAFTLIVIFAHAANTLAQNSLTSTQKLVIATYQYADNTRIKNITPFANYVTALTGITTEVKSFPTVHELLRSMEQEEVDVVFMNTFGYLMLTEKTSAYETGAVLNIPEREQNAYKSVIAIGKNIRENTLEQIIHNASDFNLVLVSPGSTSGNLVPRLKLASLQPGYPERFFLEVQYTNNHQLAMERALQGEAVVSAFGSSEYYKLGADTVRLKKLWESPSIPLGPVVFRKKLPGSLRDELQRSLLTLHAMNPDVLEAIKAGWTEAKPADKFTLVAGGHYESLMRLSNNREVAIMIIRNFAK